MGETASSWWPIGGGVQCGVGRRTGADLDFFSRIDGLLSPLATVAPSLLELLPVMAVASSRCRPIGASADVIMWMLEVPPSSTVRGSSICRFRDSKPLAISFQSAALASSASLRYASMCRLSVFLLNKAAASLICLCFHHTGLCWSDVGAWQSAGHS